jgi:hypothetical protein
LKKKNPKILVAAPTSEHKNYCFKPWIKNVKSFTYPNYDILLVDNSQDESNYKKLLNYCDCVYEKPIHGESIQKTMCRCNNLIRFLVLKGNYDYFFSLETDIFPPVNVLEYLLMFRKKVIGMPYFIYAGFMSKVLVFDIEDTGTHRKAQPMSLGKAFTQFDGQCKPFYQIGMGCLLIHRSILKKLKFRVVDDGTNSHCDTFFHNDLREMGIKTYLTTMYFADHQNRGWMNKL